MKIDLLIDRLKELKTSKLDDFVDRLHYLYTTLLLVFFVFVVGMQQTFKTSLNCRPPANYPGQWIEYVNNYCYTTGTFHTGNGSNYESNREKIYVNYYQWVPYTLAIQALSFYLPHLLYLILASFTLPGLKLQSILDRCCAASSKKEKELDEDTKEVAKSIYNYLSLSPNDQKPKSLGSSVAVSYVLSKLFNLINIALNIYFLNEFIGLGDSNWAFTVVRSAYNGIYWDQTGLFPRITFCKVPIKTVADPRSPTVQCLLMINILIEKAYIIIYFWLLALFAMTLINLSLSVWKLIVDSHSPLRALAKPLFKGNHKEYLKFCNSFMAKNGELLIRFVNEHAGTVTAHKLVENLIDLWKAKESPELSRVKVGGDYGKMDVAPYPSDE